MEALISDLLYKGYSLTYLFEWFKKQQDEFMRNGQDISIIESLRELDVWGSFGINVIAAHEGDWINANLDPDEPLAEHQIILNVGNNDDLKKVK